MDSNTKEVSGTLETNLQEGRVINIVPTKGTKTSIVYNGSDWAGLKSLLEKGGKDISGNTFSPYSLRDMKCVENINKTTLEHPKAQLPDGNFNLFLMPYKSKSGGPARDKVKQLFAENKESAKAHFGNYTQVKEEKLAELLKTYKPTTTAKTGKLTPVKNEVTKPVVVKSKDNTVANVVESLSDNNISQAKAILDSVIPSLQQVSELLGGVKVKDIIGAEPVPQEEVVSAPVKSEEDIKKEKEAEEQKQREAEKRRKEEEEKKKQQALDDECNDLMSGFSDVRR